MEQLENDRARLLPLNRHNYALLKEIAAQPGLVQYSPGILYTPEGFEAYMEKAFAETAAGQSIPFLIFDKDTDQPAGSTRYMRLDPSNKVLEIGATWMGRSFQGTGLNTAVKQLMLNAAFGPMGYEKINFRIDSRNIRSRKAVEKLGAILEGTLRKDVYLADGYKRDTCIYGLLREEWTLRPRE